MLGAGPLVILLIHTQFLHSAQETCELDLVADIQLARTRSELAVQNSFIFVQKLQCSVLSHRDETIALYSIDDQKSRCMQKNQRRSFIFLSMVSICDIGLLLGASRGNITDTYPHPSLVLLMLLLGPVDSVKNHYGS
jgi:hypothetical protein